MTIGLPMGLAWESREFGLDMPTPSPIGVPLTPGRPGTKSLELNLDSQVRQGPTPPIFSGVILVM